MNPNYYGGCPQMGCPQMGYPSNSPSFTYDMSGLPCCPYENSRPLASLIPPPALNNLLRCPAGGTGELPSAIMKQIYAACERQRDIMKRDLIEKSMPEVAKYKMEEAIQQSLPCILVQKLQGSVKEGLQAKIRDGVKEALMEALIRKYGSGIANVLQQLREGKLVCSKPCRCGQSADGADGGDGGCVKGCPCVKRARARNQQ